ncbi:uncharacterized protein LOC125047879 isoform X5 [Penaeus chinensis]|uniref:uncharacterized protein LOC125047879 isoform X5 n=1 Tax=Penaeus chinensis TaxID=139456 RepID=UPI001FB83534|nr:uncharacterized protein LOC125047879 isoform X5 [Penaeus chinensis]
MLCLKQMGDTAASPPGDDLRLAAGDSASDEEGADGADGGEAAAGGGGRRHNNTLARALCGLLASLADRLKCGRQNRKRQRREGGVALDRTSQNGLLVRMLGDVKGGSGATVETSLASAAAATGSVGDGSGGGDTDGGDDGRESSYGGGGGSGSEAEDRLLRGVVRAAGGGGSAPGSYSRFLTLHRRRRRKPPTRQMEKPHRALLDDLYHGPTQCVLSQVGVWGFNAFALDSVCGGRPVSVLCVYLLHKYGLIQHFKLDTVTVWKCFSLIEDGYHASNPYHNAIHAADVTQAMHCYLQEERISEHMKPIEVLAALVAAVCHDLDHPGVNQPFLIATDNHLAALYKNLSVLENHHWRCAMGCLWESGLLDDWDPDDVATLQDMIRSLILATDITRQQEFLSRFRRYLDASSLDMKNADHRHFSLQIALKCADICNPCRPWDVSQKWSHKICDEFYRQGDYERQLNLPVTPLCDRSVMSVAKIQTGFIKYVVSPLFDAWDRWLSTGLSASMVSNMNENLGHWEEQLAQEVAEETVTETSIAPSESPQLPIEDEEELEGEGGTTPSSSADSHQSVLGSLENVSRSLHLGRRHSVPLNVPRLVPRTVIRRESLPEADGQPLVVETVVMGGMSMTSLTSHTTDNNTTLTSDSLLPDPSITTMGGVGTSHPRHSLRLARRMSLPPVWSHSVGRHGPPLQPLSPTPSEDSTTQQNPDEDSSSKRTDDSLRTQTTGQCSGGDQSGGGEGGGGSGNVESKDSKGSHSNSDSHDLPDRSFESTTRNASASGREYSVHNRKNIQSSQGATFLHSDCSDNVHFRSRGGKVLVRRASLDSTSVSSKREFLDRLTYESSKFARVDHSDLEKDKENQVPRDVSAHRERAVPLWKTRAWRSLNYEDENACDPREKMLKPGIYKLNQTQGCMFAHGRRGSAPLLQPEELMGGLRGGAERPDQWYLSRRRGSAPSQQLHPGSEGEGCPEVPPSRLPPLTATENLPLGESPFCLSRLRGRRGSVPCDTPGSDLVMEQPVLKEQTDIRYSRRGSGGLEMLPSMVARALPSLSTSRGGISGGGAGGSGMPSSSSFYRDFHRGSGGLELLSGLWRTHLETEASLLHDDADVCSQSSGGMTPGTPGAVPPPRVNISFPLHRRGSLPTDLFYSDSVVPDPSPEVWFGSKLEGTSVCGVMRGRSNTSARALRLRPSPILLPASSAKLTSPSLSTRP